MSNTYGNMPYKAVLFDLDGILVETPDLHFAALNEALELYGHTPITRKDHEETFNGLPTRVKLERLGIQGNDAHRVMEAKQARTVELAAYHVKPDWRKQSLLWELKAKGYRLACVSNCIRESMHCLLSLAGLLPYFDVLVSNEDASRPKPSPNPYHTALMKLDVKQEEAVAVEDSPVGIESAKASGVKMVIETTYRQVDADLFRTRGLL